MMIFRVLVGRTILWFLKGIHDGGDQRTILPNVSLANLNAVTAFSSLSHPGLRQQCPTSTQSGQSQR
jgi:hypothetical protein